MSQIRCANNASRLPDLLLDHIVRVTAFALMVCGIGTAILAYAIIVVGYSPTPFADQWSPLYDLAQGKHWNSALWLWQQHNEHRIPLVRLAIVADIHLFGGRSILLYLLTALTLAFHWLIWAAFVSKVGRLPFVLWLSVVGFFGFCVFCPSQVENLYWGFEWTFISGFVFASASFVLLVWFSALGRPWMALSAACLSAFVAEGALASGVIAWPILFGAAWLLPFKTIHRCLLGSVAALTIGVYIYGYGTPQQHSNPLATIRQPGRVLYYLLTYLDHCLGSYVLYPGFAAVAISCLATASLVYLFRNPKTFPIALALTMAIAFVLTTGAITALGRLKFGVEQATASRYQVAVMLYWACVFTALLIASWNAGSQRGVIAINVLGLAVVLLPAPGIRRFLNEVHLRADFLSSIGQSLDQGALDPQAQSALIIGMSRIEPAVSYLHALGETVGPVSPLQPSSQIDETSLIKNGCLGSFDFANSLHRFFPGPQEVRAEGWALDLRTHGPVGTMAITDQNGRVLASSSIHLSRPDVLQAVPGAQGSLGWRVYAPFPTGTQQLRAYAFLTEGACFIGSK